MTNPSATWEALGGDDADRQVFYRRQELYQLLWGSVRDLSDFRVAAARRGGPVALVRDDRKPVLLPQNASLGRPKINVYSAAGALLKTIAWDAPARIVSLGWSADERLVVSADDGSFRLYELSSVVATSIGKSADKFSQHTLGSEAAESGVEQAIIHEDGIVALLSTGTFLETRGAWDNMRTVRLANSGLTAPPHCWTVVPATSSSTRSTEVLFAARDTVFRLDEIECVDVVGCFDIRFTENGNNIVMQHFNRGPFVSIEPSPSGRFVSLMSASMLYVTSIDFSRSLSEFDLTREAESNSIIPSQAWSGDNTVVVAWERKVIMVGPFGECLRYYYADPVHLIGEVDGCRILSSSVSHFLQLVPQATQDIFRPGSTAPAAILYTASELFASKSPKADDYVRSIRDKLAEATEACVEAAAREWDVDWQKRLMKAASFGKAYLDNYNPSEFVAVGKTLRVLNAVRYFEVGMPISWEQHASSTPSQLVQRLLNRSLHLLAMRISTSLSLPTAPVISHWASSLITSSTSSSMTEDELTRTIVSRLGDQEHVSSADIALTAYKHGKSSLARKLLDKEQRIERVPPVALDMGEDELALRRSLKSGDTNLVYKVLIAMRKRRGVGDFLRFVARRREAYALLETYARENDIELLRDFYFQDDRRKETALLAIDEALAVPELDVGARLTALRDASKAFDDDKDYAFEAKMADEHVRLLSLQESLEAEANDGRKFVGLSVNETIRSCLVAASANAGMKKRADKIRSDFRVPDKRFCYIALNAYVSTGDWDALWQLATASGKRSSSPPIGYEPFVSALLAAGAQRQAVRYVERCDSKDRIDLYVKCGEWLMAGHECVRRGERGKLVELRSRVPNSVIRAQLDELLEQLGGPSSR